MKEKLVPLIIIVFVGWVSYAYRLSSDQKQVGIDNVYHDFGKLVDILPPDANIGMVAHLASNADSTDLLRGFLFIRFVLAPRHLAYNSAGYDTVLTLFDRKPSEAEALAVVHNRQVLWASKGDNCLYLLTCSKKAATNP